METTTRTLYDTDYQLWLEKTLEQLRRGEFQAVDWENVFEELEDLGKNNRRALKSLLTRLLEHILKLSYWESEREYNRAGWEREIRNFRIKIADLIEESPSLKPYLAEIFPKCYTDARNLILDETRLQKSVIPGASIASLDEVLDQGWLPDTER